MTMQERQCDVCGASMRQVKHWLWTCDGCLFSASSLEPNAGADIDGLETLRRQNFVTILERLEQIKPVASCSMLEVGCAKGLFLDEVQKRGGTINGIEPDEANALIARQTGAPVTIGFFPDDVDRSKKYDVIVFNDVFEHLPTPRRMAECLPDLLNPGGLVIINLPNSDGFIYRLSKLIDRVGVSGPFERLWQKGLQSPHVSYFNPSNLKRLVEQSSPLRQADSFSLRSIAREGLFVRINSTFSIVPAGLIYAGVWLASFVEPLLPADITVAVFQKDKE